MERRVYWRLLGNLAYHHQGDRVLDDDFAAVFVPRLTAMVGVTRQLGDRHQLGLSLRVIGERGRAETLSLLNVNYELKWRRWQCFLTLHNTLDEEILHPNVGDFSDRLIDGGEGRHVRLGARYFLDL